MFVGGGWRQWVEQGRLCGVTSQAQGSSSARRKREAELLMRRGHVLCVDETGEEEGGGGNSIQVEVGWVQSSGVGQRGAQVAN